MGANLRDCERVGEDKGFFRESARSCASDFSLSSASDPTSGTAIPNFAPRAKLIRLVYGSNEPVILVFKMPLPGLKGGD